MSSPQMQRGPLQHRISFFASRLLGVFVLIKGPFALFNKDV